MQVLGLIFVYLFSAGIVAAQSGLRHHPSFRGLSMVKKSDCAPEDDARLSLRDAKITKNNLGGVGPDDINAEKIIVKKIGTAPSGPYAGEKLKMVIKVKSGNYEIGEEAKNGLLCRVKNKPDKNNVVKKQCFDRNNPENNNDDPFAQINMVGGDGPVTLGFEIKTMTGSNDVELDAFVFSVFDIDKNDTAIERYTIKGWGTEQYEGDGDIQVDVSTDNGINVLDAEAMHSGRECDNPISPFDLGMTQCKNGPEVNPRLRAFQVVFRNKSSFEVELDFRGPDGSESDPDPVSGRNMLWAFNSQLEDLCDGLVC